MTPWHCAHPSYPRRHHVSISRAGALVVVTISCPKLSQNERLNAQREKVSIEGGDSQSTALGHRSNVGVRPGIVPTKIPLCQTPERDGHTRRLIQILHASVSVELVHNRPGSTLSAGPIAHHLAI